MPEGEAVGQRAACDERVRERPEFAACLDALARELGVVPDFGEVEQP